jgi:hypothetical protein
MLSLYARGQFVGNMTRTGPPGSTQTNQNEQIDEEGKYRPPEYTLKRYFRSLAGKDTLNLSRLWVGSLILPGSAQIYNKDYWKLPVLYGGILGFTYGGIHNNNLYHKSGDSRYKLQRTLFYAAAAFTWWGGVLDGAVSFKYDKPVLPARASIYSAMLPGLGQAYNGDYWKIPIIYGGFITVGYFISSNNYQYRYYKNLHNLASTPESGYTGSASPETLKYYRDTYRRYRDYSILAGVIVYALNVIDANVFAHLQDFDMSDDISASISPVVIEPLDYRIAKNTAPSLGLSLNIRF